jgi:hypothetical protein
MTDLISALQMIIKNDKQSVLIKKPKDEIKIRKTVVDNIIAKTSQSVLFDIVNKAIEKYGSKINSKKMLQFVSVNTKFDSTYLNLIEIYTAVKYYSKFECDDDIDFIEYEDITF